MVQRIKEHVNLRLLGLMLVIALFIGLSLWNEPLPFSVKAQATPAVEGTSVSLPVVMAEPTTAPPPELIENQNQTNGIVFGSSLLILIVVISTISVMRTRNKITKSAVEKKGE